MSKLYEALRNTQASVQDHRAEAPLVVPEISDPDMPGYTEVNRFPSFTDYDIDEIVEYLHNSYLANLGESFGIVPVGDDTLIAPIVLETFMYLAANCDVAASLTDLAANRPMLASLKHEKAFDAGQSLPRGRSVFALSVLNSQFDYVVVNRSPTQGNRSRRQLAVDLLKFSQSYELSMFLFPPVAKFNPFCVQMARRVDKLILVAGDDQQQAVVDTGQFLQNLDLEAHGVYLLT